MILITGAAGKTGQAVIRALQKRTGGIRAFVHSQSQLHLIHQLGVRDVIIGDMSSLKDMSRAVKGVRSVYHICPNVNAGEIKMGKVLIRAAQTEGITHVVYHSVLHPQIEAMPHHWKKMRVEEKLFESGLDYTILQPAPYMQNILAYWNTAEETGKLPIPFSGHTRLNLVDLNDVAEVAALVLNEPGHEGAAYELCGSENFSQIEIAQILSQYLGHKIEIEVIPLEFWEDNARTKGMDDYQITTLIKMFKYYERFGMIGNSHVLTNLLHRPPTGYQTFIEKILKDQAGE